MFPWISFQRTCQNIAGITVDQGTVSYVVPLGSILQVCLCIIKLFKISIDIYSPFKIGLLYFFLFFSRFFKSDLYKIITINNFFIFYLHFQVLIIKFHSSPVICCHFNSFYRHSSQNCIYPFFQVGPAVYKESWNEMNNIPLDIRIEA